MPKTSGLTPDSTFKADDELIFYDPSGPTTKRGPVGDLVNYFEDEVLPDRGWSLFGQALTPITALGNRSYSAVVSGVDTTAITSVGMRFKLPRTVTAPTQCADLEASSSQYLFKTSPAGMTFTDDPVVSAWVKLESYTGTNETIVSRFNGTSGWGFRVLATGQLILFGNNAGGSNNSFVTSYQSVPLGRWVHVAAQLDMSSFTATTTTSYIMIDGVDVPAFVTRGGTNPTALVQAGNLEIGSENGGSNYFDGKLAQVAIYSAKVTQATIKASMNQTLTGSETSLVSAYTLSNSLLDLTANDNDLTASGSATATNTDTPFTNPVTGTNVAAGTTNYGIIMSQAFSTNTTYVIQVPEGETLPTTGGIGTVSYSTQKTPYGFPGQKGKWMINSIIKSQSTQVATGGTWYNIGNHSLSLPIGEWDLSYTGSHLIAGSSVIVLFVSLSTSASSETNSEFSTEFYNNATTNIALATYKRRPVSITSTTPYYLIFKSAGSGTPTIYNLEAETAVIVEAENGYL